LLLINCLRSSLYWDWTCLLHYNSRRFALIIIIWCWDIWSFDATYLTRFITMTSISIWFGRCCKVLSAILFQLQITHNSSHPTICEPMVFTTALLPFQIPKWKIFIINAFIFIYSLIAFLFTLFHYFFHSLSIYSHFNQWSHL